MSIKDKLINGEVAKEYKKLIGKGFHVDMWGKRCKRISKSIELIEFYSELFENFKGLNVLDIGCFSGLFTFLISDIANYVIGVDKSPTPIQCANTIKSNLEISNINFINKYIGEFIQDKDHLSLNIDALFIHKSMGQMVKREVENLRSIVPLVKIIIITGEYLNDIKGFDKEEKSKLGIWILRKI